MGVILTAWLVLFESLVAVERMKKSGLCGFKNVDEILRNTSISGLGGLNAVNNITHTLSQRDFIIIIIISSSSSKGSGIGSGSIQLRGFYLQFILL
jgi:hypothetical protein